MKQSLYFIPTTKQIPSDAQIASHQILLQGGYVKQTAAGIYSYLPLGQKVMQNIEQIIREELNAIDAHEIFMPVLQPLELWEQSGRLAAYGPELMKLTDRHDRNFALGPTHEEVITDIVRDFVKTYKKLPLTLYQIQTKFRDELRPRFGLMRGREFSMMDAYSFTATAEDTDIIYDKMSDAYEAILTKMKLNYRKVSALSGEIGGSESAEFMILSHIGEDTVVYSDESSFAANLEVYPDMKEGDSSPDGKGLIKFAKGIEIGHIFKLGTKYSELMGATFTNSLGKLEPIIMGCYGMGVSRLLMALIEGNQVENKLVWPLSVAPFQVHLLVANTKNEQQQEAATSLYNQLKDEGLNILFDDRDERLGAKFGDADLIGSPIRIIVGKDICENEVECNNRITDETTKIKLNDVAQTLKKWLI
ncbi:MAG: proline--tRNA ligase [Culicoidibacterales bacterium]